MRWLDALRGAPTLDAVQASRLVDYRALDRPDARAPLAKQRFVVVDVETSGLNPYSDRLISIGAIGVHDGLVHLDESFEVLLRQERPSTDENILVHGIGGSAQLAGRESAAGLIDFLQFAGKAPLVGFHADFDRVVIERATAAALGIKPSNAWLDLAFLAPAVLTHHQTESNTLDEWMEVLAIDNYARHDAVADALATAQLLLVVLAEAQKQGAKSRADLRRLEKARRWLGR